MAKQRSIGAVLRELEAVKACLPEGPVRDGLVEALLRELQAISGVVAFQAGKAEPNAKAAK